VPTLLALFGARRGIARDLTPRTVIGRGKGVDVMLIDDRVSREHCVIEQRGDQWWVVDLGSRNGTWLDGTRVEAACLAPDVRLGVGDSVFVFAPTARALRAHDGSSTLVLTSAAAESGALTAHEASAGAGDEAWLWSLAQRCGAAPSRESSLTLLAQELLARSGATAVGVVSTLPGGGQRLVLGLPAGAALTVPSSLWARLDESAPAGSVAALSAPAEQVEALRDSHTTRARARAGQVMLAPASWHQARVGAVVATFAGRPDESAVSLLVACAALAAPHLRPTAPLEPGATEGSAPVFVAHSAAMRHLLGQLDRLAPTDASVLLTGPTGVGKELLARRLHQHSRRAAGPLVAINCGAIPAELAESVLFGHERGAFTGATSERRGLFERADGGTLFLDEVGELPAALQVKLLRVLEERVVERLGAEQPRPVDVRLVAATHRALPERVAAGQFREDLYYRLRVAELVVPPLAQRPDDVPPLAEYLLQRAAHKLGVPAKPLSEKALRALQAYAWPGNVRELAHALERALVLGGPGAELEVEDLPAELLVSAAPGRAAGARTLEVQVTELEARVVREAMRAARGVKARAAELLGISRPTLDKKLEAYGIEVAP
jgi:DNA-binding NtrC family response regulator